MEAHLLDWDGDLYGREIEVALYERIRPELKFATVEELVAEIERGVDRVREIMSALAPDADPARGDGAGPPGGVPPIPPRDGERRGSTPLGDALGKGIAGIDSQASCHPCSGLSSSIRADSLANPADLIHTASKKRPR